jgi:hypothetical protein
VQWRNGQAPLPMISHAQGRMVKRIKDSSQIESNFPYIFPGQNLLRLGQNFPGGTGKHNLVQFLFKPLPGPETWNTLGKESYALRNTMGSALGIMGC